MYQTLGRGTILVSYFILAIGAAVALFPLSLMVVSALKTSAEIVANPLALPSALQWVNFSRAWTDAQLGRSLLNSAETTGLAVVLICSTSSMAAYALARQIVRGWRWISAAQRAHGPRASRTAVLSPLLRARRLGCAMRSPKRERIAGRIVSAASIVIRTARADATARP